ncbi:MAG TPA: hypothetical protein VIZ18_16200, partial [Ktedonobacteraceae bacterium]
DPKLEQRRRRGTRQSAQMPQTDDVWTRQIRFAASASSVSAFTVFSRKSAGEPKVKTVLGFK